MTDCIWVNKYEPKTIDEMCLTDDLKQLFNSFVNGKKALPHLSLSGQKGIGKTTIAKILSNLCATDTLFVDGGLQGGVDDIRTIIPDFCSTMSLDDKPKIVLIDEADGLSKTTGSGSSAQDALRTIINTYELRNCRFILTFNHINKMLDPMMSRCTPINITFDNKSILKRCIYILDAEKIEYTKEAIENFYANVILKKYPDIRSIINILYLWVVDGKFIAQNISTSTELESFIKKELLPLVSKKKFDEARVKWLNNESLFSSDYQILTGALFQISDNIKNRLLIGKALTEMAVVLDKEIQFMCLMYSLFDN